MLSAVRVEASRVTLRKAHHGDRERLIELRTDPDVWRYLGGPQQREAVEQRLDDIGGAAQATRRPGTFVIADRATDRLLGTIELDRRSAEEPGHVTETGEELELSYLMHRDTWGTGLAFEAAAAILRAAAEELPDQPVLVVTQTANKRSLNLAARLGFEPVRTFRQYNADQTLAAVSLHACLHRTL
ncbi:GNAT family N-acetyltransferase [Amycolatopsis sp. NPDC003676]